MDLPAKELPAKATYDELAHEYDQRWRGYIDRSLAKILSLLNLRGDERVLDVACGTGEMERRLLAAWPRLKVLGVDLSSEMLARAKEKHIPGEITWIEGDATRLPAATAAYDLILCANSFHYFRKPTDSLAEFRRCLAPGGKLIILDWCDDYLLCKLCNIWLRLTDPAYFCIYTLAALRSLVTTAGFQILHAERFKANWLWGMMVLVLASSEHASDQT